METNAAGSAHLHSGTGAATPTKRQCHPMLLRDLLHRLAAIELFLELLLTNTQSLRHPACIESATALAPHICISGSGRT